MEDATPAIPLRPQAAQELRPVLGSRPALRAVASSFLVSRLLLLVATAAATIVHRPPLDLWNRWDSVWYLGIAAHGYSWTFDGKPSLAFFPLFPLLIHLLSPFMSPLVAGLLIANLAFLGALFYLHALFEQVWDAHTSRRALWLIALFPTAFFTAAPYTESLFLLCASAAMYHSFRRQAGHAGIWAALAVLTRSTGIALLPAIVAILYSRAGTTAGDQVPVPSRFDRLMSLAQALIPSALALAAYGWYIAAHGLRVTEVLSAQRSWHRGLAAPWVGFTSSVDWLVNHWMENPAWAVENTMQLGVVLVFLAVTALAWREMPVGFRLYCAGFWALTLMSPEWLDGFYAPFSSMNRMVLALFPLAGWVAWRLPLRGTRNVAAVFAVLMTATCAVHLGGGWVG